MTIIIVLGSYGGVKLDEYFETENLCTVICSLLAVCIAIYLAIKDVIKINDKK